MYLKKLYKVWIFCLCVSGEGQALLFFALAFSVGKNKCAYCGLFFLACIQRFAFALAWRMCFFKILNTTFPFVLLMFVWSRTARAGFQRPVFVQILGELWSVYLVEKKKTSISRYLFGREVYLDLFMLQSDSLIRAVWELFWTKASDFVVFVLSLSICGGLAT